MRTILFPDFFSLADAPARETNRSHVVENEQGYFIQLDIPGVPKEKLKISTEKKQLVVEGERQTRDGLSSIRRAFWLPDDVDADRIEAQLKDGVLELALPKKEAAKPKLIAVGEGKESFFQKLIG